MAAAAAGKKSTTSLSLFMEAYGLEVEEELSTAATEHWAGVWTTWKQVRGPAGAVMCETRDLEIKWPCWHTLVFCNEITIDMRYVCPQNVKKMLCRGPDQCIGRSGKQSTSMKSSRTSFSSLAKESEGELN